MQSQRSGRGTQLSRSTAYHHSSMSLSIDPQSPSYSFPPLICARLPDRFILLWTRKQQSPGNPLKQVQRKAPNHPCGMRLPSPAQLAVSQITPLSLPLLSLGDNSYRKTTPAPIIVWLGEANVFSVWNKKCFLFAPAFSRRGNGKGNSA